MFYNFIYPLHDYWSFLNLFQYLTVRAGGALMTAFFICLFLGPGMIAQFRVWQHGSQTVKDVAHSAASRDMKRGTPTMGGVLILVGVVTASLLWMDLQNPYGWLVLGVMLCFGGIGLLDDYFSIKKLWKGGVPGKVRLLIQFSFSLVLLSVAVQVHGGPDATHVYLPFLKDLVVQPGFWGFLAFGAFVIVGSANAVNLTDGLDGLVSIPVVIVAMSLAGLSYVIGRADFTAYLGVSYIPGAGEISVVCAALAGGALGFLWFNAPPARIFMGDTGALSIGATLGTVSVLIKQEFVLAIVGGLFVLETVSVIVQVVSFKLTGKRVFRMAPLHHHFEQLGWPETTIVVRFWIIAILLALVGLATLKIR